LSLAVVVIRALNLPRALIPYAPVTAALSKVLADAALCAAAGSLELAGCSAVFSTQHAAADTGPSVERSAWLALHSLRTCLPLLAHSCTPATTCVRRAHCLWLAVDALPLASAEANSPVSLAATAGLRGLAVCRLQERMNQLWIAAKRDLEEVKAHLRAKEREREDLSEGEGVEIKVGCGHTGGDALR